MPHRIVRFREQGLIIGDQFCKDSLTWVPLFAMGMIC